MKTLPVPDTEYLSSGEGNLPSLPNTSSFQDRVSLAIATFGGIGYLPLVPATWGSFVTAGLYFFFQYAAEKSVISPTSAGISSWMAMLVFIGFLFVIGTWAASHVTKIKSEKDPGIIVIDEVVGQLITFLFVPAGINWVFFLIGFFVFRFFDIWKPFPARQLEKLPSGFGVMADDVMAGIYSAVVLWIIYSATT